MMLKKETIAVLADRQRFKQQPNGGSIVNISSVHSPAVLPGWGPDDAAKWGVVGMGKNMAVERAAVIGQKADAAEYNRLATAIRRAFVKEFVSRDARTDPVGSFGHRLRTHQQDNNSELGLHGRAWRHHHP